MHDNDSTTAPTPTLPGDIPGLLRRGSPVIALIGRAKAATRALVFGHGVDHNGVLVGTSSDGVRWLPDDCLALDLSDATGRAHAAWWLARNAPRAPMAASVYDDEAQRFAPGVFRDDRRYALFGCLDGVPRGGGWLWDCVSAPPGIIGRLPPCHALANLDPNDPRLLPDGSRWVDAEALRRVCLHVAGR